jgi:hypothetical protein
VRMEGLGQLKKSSDLIENRTRNVAACSIVPQPTTLSRAPFPVMRYMKIASAALDYLDRRNETNTRLFFNICCDGAKRNSHNFLRTMILINVVFAGRSPDHFTRAPARYREFL